MEIERPNSPDKGPKRRSGPRRKTGIFTCKSRHTRCDEKKPVCSNCERLGLQCRASEFIAYSAWSSVDSNQRVVQSKNVVLMETTPSTSSTSQTDAGNASSCVSPECSPGVPTPSSTSLPSSQLTPALSPPVNVKPPPSALLPLNGEKAYLLNAYRMGMAKWMDIFDPDDTYETEILRRALYSELLLRCICAFTAKQLSQLASGDRDVWQPVASRYYLEALNRLISEVSCPEMHSDALTAAMLLSSYEHLAASDASHRSHYQGALNLIRSRGISANSDGIDRANFFVLVRHEISVALANESPLQFDPRDWNVTRPGIGASEDQVSNYLMLLAGNAVNLVFDSSSTVDRQSLLDSVEDWYNNTSATFRGITYGEVNAEGLTKVFFAVTAAAAAMMWYHLTYILLLAEPRLSNPDNDSVIQEHANRILSIGISDISDAALAFSIMPIYFEIPLVHVAR
ncbi:uncharacterized protein BCR38DRAFT_129443 [Pseudomassariella vexata]|uniref:Zn(2)-C6 fungal-type domain-containing protein n=1 Tax=Pseudomassariella vexata TaxID=1141098 RepID=A0A1Y2E9P0_9PEZI|nr:uncharacterized protein BCR38DRAFT_129443 [Pseudomassariella vexata]ORY68269.1 hypothetical protein BCR38DRAFT_129443 [Pseudomassariella vexata]